MRINSEMASQFLHIYKMACQSASQNNSAMRNFLWTRGIDKTNLVTIVWEKNVLPCTIYGFS